MVDWFIFGLALGGLVLMIVLSMDKRKPHHNNSESVKPDDKLGEQ